MTTLLLFLALLLGGPCDDPFAAGYYNEAGQYVYCPLPPANDGRGNTVDYYKKDPTYYAPAPETGRIVLPTPEPAPSCPWWNVYCQLNKFSNDTQKPPDILGNVTYKQPGCKDAAKPSCFVYVDGTRILVDPGTWRRTYVGDYQGFCRTNVMWPRSGYSDLHCRSSR